MGVVEQGRRKMGREPVSPSRRQVAYTKLGPQMIQQWRKLMGTLFCSPEKAAPNSVSPFLIELAFYKIVCAPREG